MRLPSLKFLKTFQVAALLLSFKAAAEELFLTASAVSHQIKALEEQLGTLLFDRGPRALLLTAAGARYLEQINEMFLRLEQVTEELKLHYGRTTVRLHVPPLFASEILLPRLQSFWSQRTESDLRIDTVISAAHVFPADADLSVVVGSGPWEGMRSHRLFAQNFVPACAPAVLARAPIRSVADLERHTLIVHEARRDAWERWTEARGFEPPRRSRLVRLDSLSAVMRAAEQGLGIALVPYPLSAARFGSGSLVPVFEDELCTRESYFMLCRSGTSERRDVEDLAAWILRECRPAAGTATGDSTTRGLAVGRSGPPAPQGQ
jgi:DNA-binding transcriptional LysR family regulator